MQRQKERVSEEKTARREIEEVSEKTRKRTKTEKNIQIQSKRHINHINFLPLSAIHWVSMHDTIKIIYTAVNGVYTVYLTIRMNTVPAISSLEN